MMKRIANQAFSVMARRAITSNMQAVRSNTGLLQKLQSAPVAQQVIAARYARLDPVSMSEIEGRTKYVLECYDKIDQEKFTMQAHFIKDLGLDSLDHVEVIVAIENEFMLEIDDKTSETLMTAQEICDYLSDRFDASLK
jgi:NADH dehydrogenase (ubiquinone) 1 alpha/beta subcomplex 1